MRLIASFLLLILILIEQSVFGQAEKSKQDLYKPFSILIVKPEAATIADSLRMWADSIERKYIDRHYYAIRTLESMKEAGDEEWQRKMDERLKAKELEEMDVYSFKFYHTLANSTLFELGVLFNTQYWEKNFHSTPLTVLEGYTIDRSELFTHDLEKLGQYYNVDYIVTFENVYTDNQNGVGVLNYTITLFWTKKNKVLFQKQIQGNAPVINHKSLSQIANQKSTKDKFAESEVDCTDYLDCMFTSAIRFSTEELFMVIAKNQKK